MSAGPTARAIAAGILVAAALGACASPSAGGPTGAPASSVATAGPASPGATAGAGTAAPPATAKPAKVPSVDLVMSGVASITLHGTAGTCTIGTMGGTPTKFGFQAVEADYAGLGNGLYIEEGNGGYVTIKWLPNATIGYINIADIKGAVSADHLSITLDHDIKGSPGVEHLKGTITCP